jgi:hypothetical protein
MGQFTAYVLDTYVAPGLSGFTSADIPDLRPEFEQAEHWLSTHFLNTVFRGRFDEGVQRQMLGLLRRAHCGFRSYHRARDRTLTFLGRLAAGDQPLMLYWDAVSEWEVFVLELQMATELYRSLTDWEQVFASGDGSPEQRLYDAANTVKHAGGKLSSGTCRPEDTLPLWVLGDGIHCLHDLRISYEEAAGALRQISEVANKLQDPVSFVTGATG